MRRLFRRGEAKDEAKDKAKDGADDDDDDDDDDLALVGAVARYCLAKGSLDHWRRFFDDREDEFWSAGEAETGEHALRHTDIHADFVALVEASIADFLRGRGHDAASFYAVVARLADRDGGDRDGPVATFVALMLMATEYGAFADVARDREKRRYFFAVLERWSDTLD